MTEVSKIRATLHLSPWFHWLGQCPKQEKEQGGFDSATPELHALLSLLSRDLSHSEMSFYFTDADFPFISGIQPSVPPRINTGFWNPVAFKSNVTPRLAIKWGVNSSKASDTWISLFLPLDYVTTKEFAHDIMLSENRRTCVYVCYIYGWTCECTRVCMCFREMH